MLEQEENLLSLLWKICFGEFKVKFALSESGLDHKAMIFKIKESVPGNKGLQKCQQVENLGTKLCILMEYMANQIQ